MATASRSSRPTVSLPTSSGRSSFFGVCGSSVGLVISVPTGSNQGIAQQILNLRVDAPELIRRPLVEAAVELGVEAQQESLLIRQQIAYV